MKQFTILVTVVLVIMVVVITGYTQRHFGKETTLAISVSSFFPFNFNEALVEEQEEKVHELVTLLLRKKRIKNLKVISTDVNIFGKEWDFLAKISVESLGPDQTLFCLKVYTRTLDVSELDQKIIDLKRVPSAVTVYATDHTLGMHYMSTDSQDIAATVEELTDGLSVIMQGLIATETLFDPR